MKDNKYVILKAISSQFEYYLMEAPSSTYGWMMKLVSKGQEEDGTAVIIY